VRIKPPTTFCKKRKCQNLGMKVIITVDVSLSVLSKSGGGGKFTEFLRATTFVVL